MPGMHKNNFPRSKMKNPMNNESQNDRQIWQLLSFARNGHLRFR